MSLSLLNWNIRGLRSNSTELKVLLRDYNACVVALQETKLSSSSFMFGLNYTFYGTNPRPGAPPAGGAAILVRRDVNSCSVTLVTALQAAAVSVTLDRTYTVCSLYLEPGLQVSLQDLHELIDQLPSPFILVGDFNAHNPLWHCRRLDGRGKVVEELLSSRDVVLLNDESPTHHDTFHNSFSTIDLGMCSSSIFLDLEWSVLDELHGSDHFPICVKSTVGSPPSSPPRWLLEEADWGSFRATADTERSLESFSDHQAAYTFFTELLIVAAERSIPRTTGRLRRPPVPWWDGKCTELKRSVRSSYRRLRRSYSQGNLLAYQGAQASKRRYYKKAKTESWQRYVGGINAKTPISRVWGRVRKLCGRFVPRPAPALTVDDSLVTDHLEVSTYLASHFADVSHPSRYSPEFQERRLAFHAPPPVHSGESNQSYDDAYTFVELEHALSLVGSTSPGEDDIHYEMLRRLSPRAKHFLLALYNAFWCTGTLPPEWKVSVIVPILKPNKPKQDASSYRPIALTSCLCKVFERMINSRLVWWLELHGHLSDVQFGFRRGRCSIDPLLRLTTAIQNSFVQDGHTLAVFFDLEKAYDTTWRGGILQSLHDMGVRGRMYAFLYGFLPDRSIKVRVGSTVSPSFTQEEGVPQGSVLSVTCFLAAINGVVRDVLAPVRCSLYADDLAIYCSGVSLDDICLRLQRAVNSVLGWAGGHGFRFSATKTVAMHFTRRRMRQVPPHIVLGGVPLPYEKTVVFLGMCLDPRLSWIPHLKTLREKVLQSLSILKVVSSNSWGADTTSLLRLYDALCRSKLDYGCQIYASASKTALRMLDPVHHKAIRICTGAFHTSPVDSLYAVSGQLPLDLRREELSLRYLFRLHADTSNPAYRTLTNTRSDTLYDARRSSPSPMRLRLAGAVDSGLLGSNIRAVTPSTVPPWRVPPVQVCPLHAKRDRPQQEVAASFLAHQSEHKDTVCLYTDGSKSVGGVGCAVVSPTSCWEGRLPDVASIFTAELSAILHALVMIFNMDGSHFVVHSDSQSVLLSLKQFMPVHPLVRQAQEWLYRIHSRYKKSVCFCWVPAHVGICGNERADAGAKRAVTSQDYCSRSTPHTDLRVPVRRIVRGKWQSRFDSLPANKLRTIKPELIPVFPQCSRDVRLQRVVTRLRIGHTRLTHGHLLAGDPMPLCTDCRIPLTVRHLLVECPALEAIRQRHGLANQPMAELLGSRTDPEGLRGFLVEVGVFYNL